MDFALRAQETRAKLNAENLDALLVTNLDNIRWLSGFSGSAARLIAAQDKFTLVTDGRYEFQAQEEVQAAGADVSIIIENAKQKEAILDSLSGSQKIGLEAEDISWAAYRTMDSKWFKNETEITATSGFLEELRRNKDEGEAARIKRAAEIADQAFEAVILSLKEGMTEKEIARALEAEMLERGAEGPSFETIVAIGEHAAWAHARPGDIRLTPQTLVLIDMGALVEGYHSDMSRTFSLGMPGETQSRMYEVVKDSQQAGLDSVKPGASCSEVDQTCRQIIEAAGWGSAFSHSTGHGVGLNIHENPRISSLSEEALIEGEAVTVEPGVYIAPYGGVRIEDTVLVTADGCELLTLTPKQLILN